MTTQNKDLKTMLIDLENKLADVFIKKLPAMPENAKETIVKYGPYITLIIMVLSLPALLAIFGLGAVFAPFAFLGGVGFGFRSIISLIFGIVMLGLELMALQGLFKRELKAWKILFYISLFNAISAILRFDFGGLIIGSGISWYILFQIRSYYKN